MGIVTETEQLIEKAQKSGYRIRYEYFGGTGGGKCEVNGRKWIFLDLAQNGIEQLEVLRAALANESTRSSG